MQHQAWEHVTTWRNAQKLTTSQQNCTHMNFSFHQGQKKIKPFYTFLQASYIEIQNLIHILWSHLCLWLSFFSTLFIHLLINWIILRGGDSEVQQPANICWYLNWITEQMLIKIWFKVKPKKEKNIFPFGTCHKLPSFMSCYVKRVYDHASSSVSPLQCLELNTISSIQTRSQWQCKDVNF